MSGISLMSWQHLHQVIPAPPHKTIQLPLESAAMRRNHHIFCTIIAWGISMMVLQNKPWLRNRAHFINTWIHCITVYYVDERIARSSLIKSGTVGYKPAFVRYQTLPSLAHKCPDFSVLMPSPITSPWQQRYIKNPLNGFAATAVYQQFFISAL